MGKKAKEPAEVNEEIDQTRAELGKDARKLRKKVKERGGVKGAARSEAKAGAKKKLKTASQKAENNLESAPQKAKAATKKRPLAGVVAAFGTGWALRSLAKSRRQDNRK